LGEFLQLPFASSNSTPKIINNDVINTTSNFQKYTTRGTTAKVQEITFPGATQDEYDDFIAWYTSDDRANNFFFVQFEDEMTVFEPFFCKLVSFELKARHILTYEMMIELEEAK
jgi:hypothetical protein